MRKQSLGLDWLATSTSVGTSQRMAVMVTVLLLIMALAATHILEEENSSLRSEIASRSLDQRAKAVSPPVAAEEAAKRSKANQLIAQHNELVAVLEMLERVAPDGVLIESMSLNPESKTYRIELRTAELEAARRYVDKLNAAGAARPMWHIVSVEVQKQSVEWLAVLERL